MFEAPKKEAPTIGLTPLIDVVFILLIFVVLAANFDRVKGIKVDLPQGSHRQETNKKPVVVTVTGKGKLFINQKQFGFKQLIPKLKELRKKHKILLLRADGAVAFQHAVKVLDSAAIVGFEAVSIATKQSEK